MSTARLPEKINLAERFARIPEPWSPRVAGELHDFQVKLAKLEGAFVWHHHAEEDELFLVIRGRLRMRLRDGGEERELLLDPGELVIVPHGVEHCPEADEECWVLLLEPRTTLNTGNLVNERTVRDPGRI